MPRGYPGRMKGTNVSALSYAKMIRLLEEGTRSMQEIADELGLHYMTVCEYLRALHNEKMIHINMWEQDAKGRHSIKIFILGGGKDAKKITKPRIKVAQEYRARQALKKLNQKFAGENNGIQSSTVKRSDYQLSGSGSSKGTGKFASKQDFGSLAAVWANG